MSWFDKEPEGISERAKRLRVVPSEKLCIFCKHFRWSTERAWGMGSTATGPMMEGGDATCAAGQYKGEWDNYPSDEGDFREIILRGEKCEKYERP